MRSWLLGVARCGVAMGLAIGTCGVAWGGGSYEMLVNPSFDQLLSGSTTDPMGWISNEGFVPAVGGCCSDQEDSKPGVSNGNLNFGNSGTVVVSQEVSLSAVVPQTSEFYLSYGVQMNQQEGQYWVLAEFLDVSGFSVATLRYPDAGTAVAPSSATVQSLSLGRSVSARFGEINKVRVSVYGQQTPYVWYGHYGPSFSFVSLVAAQVAPAAVTALVATGGNASVTLSWAAPSTTSTVPSDYVIDYSADGGTTWLTFQDGESTATSATVTGLANGTLCQFRVSAMNAMGTSAPSVVATAKPSSPPQLDGIPDSWTVTEDVSSDLTFNRTPLADAEDDTLMATLSVPDGTLSAAASVSSVVTVSSSTTVSGSSVILTGKAADLNAYLTTLGNLRYQPPQNATQSRTATLSVSDGTLSVSKTVTLQITAVNDAPTVIAPASVVMTEDNAGNLTFTGTPFADIDSSILTVTLSVSDGTITGNAGTGITVWGTAIARIFSGTVSDLNTYFTTAGKITYQGALNNTENRTLTTTVSDGTDTTIPPVSGYARWFDASTLNLANGASVVLWPDGSGSGYDAIKLSDRQAPKFVSDAGTGTGLGAVTFTAGVKNPDGKSTVLDEALGFTRDTAIRSVFSVFKGSSFLLTDSGEFHFHRPSNDEPNVPLWVYLSNPFITAGNTYVNQVLVNGLTFSMPTEARNGFNLVSVLTTGPVSADSFNRDRIELHSGTQSHAEVILYDRVLSDAERVLMENYLSAKWFGPGRRASVTSTVSFTPVNDAPTLAAITDPAAILEDAGAQTVNLTGIAAGGGETQGLTVTATSSNTGLIPDPTVTYTSAATTGSLSYTPVANASGTATITVTVTDNGGTDNSGVATTTQTFTVAVTAVNDAPTLTTLSTLTGATEDTAFTISYATLAAAANEADVDGDTLSFRVEAVNSGTLTKGVEAVSAGTTILSSAESLVWTPAANASGTLNAFTIKAWDGTTTSATAIQVQVMVTAVNDVPTVTSIGAQTTLEDTSTGLIGFSLTDSETLAGNLTVSATSSNPELVAVSGIRLGSSDLSLGSSQGLIGRWSFDSVDDLGKNAVTGAALVKSGNPVWSSNGKIGGAVEFNGSSLLSASTSTIENLPLGSSSYSVSLWFKARTLNYGGFIGWGVYGSQNKVNAFRLNGNASLHNYWWANDLSASTGSAMAENVWYHAVVTYDGAIRSIYLNGQKIASGASSGADVQAGNFEIGKTQGPEYFDGWMDEVAIYNRALSETEITQLAQGAGKDRTITLTPMPDASGTSTITVTVTDEANATATTSFVLTVNPVNDTPVVNASQGQTQASEQVAVVVDGGITVSDADNATLASATVTVSGGYRSSEDVLGYVSNSQATGNISGSFDANTGVLTLTSDRATATLAQWQGALRSVTYLNTSARTVAMVVNDGLLVSAAVTKTVSLTAVPDAVSVEGLTAASKVYDGTRVASVTGTPRLVGVPDGADVRLQGTPVFTLAQATAGAAVTIQVSGLTLVGAQAADYTLVLPQLVGDITPKPISINGLSGVTKVYDGTTAATVSGTATLSGVVSDDVGQVILSGTPVSTFASANVGTGIAITTAGYTVSGAAAANYTLTQPTGLTGTITAKALSIGAPTIASKIYDGTTVAGAVTVGELSGTVSPETLVVTGTAAAYNSAAVGTYQTVVVTYTLANGSGNTAGLAANYSLAAGSASGTVTGRALTVTSAVVTSKAYDGTTVATITGTLSGVLNSDLVTLVDTGTFASKNVGANQVVTSTSTLSGAAAGNYTLTQPTGLTGTITAKALSIGAPTIASKIYDGTTVAGAVTVGELSGTVSPETLVVTGTAAAYNSAAVGTYQTVVVTYTLANGSGNTAGLAANYSLAAGSARGTITPRELVITVDPVSLMSDFDGQSHGVVWTTTPAGISVEALYNGSTTLPKVAGSYSVTLSSADPRFSARLEVTLVIRKSVQGITLSSAVVAAGLQTVSDSSGRYLLQATLGQPIAGPASAVSGMQLNSGFWFTEQFSAALDGRNLVGAKLESKIRASVILRGASIDAPEATDMGPEISRPALGVPPSTRLTVLPAAGSGDVWIRVSGVPSGRWLIQYQDRLHSDQWLDEGLVELDGDGLGAVRAATGVGEMRFYRLVQQ